MRKLFKKLFHTEDVEKLKKDSYMSGIIMSLVTILICLVAMCGSAYAFFTATLTSGNNVIKAADYDIDVELVDEVPSTSEEEEAVPEVVADPAAVDPEAVEPIVEDTTEPKDSSGKSAEYKNNKYRLSYSSSSEKYEKFIFHLKKEGTARTGYCKVTFEMGNQSITGYTKQIGAVLNKDGNSESVDERYMTVLVPAGSTVEVSFEAQWGTYGGYALIEDEVIDLGYLFSVDPMLEESEDEEEPSEEGEEVPPVEGEEETPVEGEEETPVEREEETPVEREEETPVEREEESPVEDEEVPSADEGGDDQPDTGEEQTVEELF